MFMKKAITIIAAMAAAISTLSAQYVPQQDINAGIEKAAAAVPAEEVEKSWTSKGVAGANVSQASFDNWAAGGDASIAFDLMLNYDLNYKKGRHLWTNRLEMAYGINRTSTNGLRKTNDKIYFASNYGYGIADKLYLGAMLTFNTQFANGYNYKALSDGGLTPGKDNYISRFMAPGYLTLGVGVIWTPYSWLKLTYSPVSWRGTFVMDDMLSDAGAYGVTAGHRTLNQFGSDLVAEVNKKLWEKLNLYSRLELYSNYLNKPQNVIVHWDTMLSMNITKWLSASFNINLIYDDNIKIEQPDGRIGPRLQVKQVLGIGLQANF